MSALPNPLDLKHGVPLELARLQQAAALRRTRRHRVPLARHFARRFSAPLLVERLARP
jgi:hypothetical protein